MARTRKIFFGWWVVLSAAIGLLFSYSPILVFSFGVFVSSLARDFHANRTRVALAFTLASVMISVGSPVAGLLTDRFGARRVIIPSIALLGLLLLSLKFISTSLWQLYAVFLALGLIGSVTNPVAYCRVVSNWFDRRRGLALGLTMLGLGVGAIVMPLIAQRLIALYGWRSAFGIFGVVVLAFPTLPVTLFFRSTPSEMGLLPDGEGQAPSGHARGDSEEGISASVARGSRAFWLIAAGFCLAGGAAQACVVNLVPMLMDRGLSAETAALASSMLGVTYVLGRVVAGYLVDRIFASYVAACLFAGMALGLALLWVGSAAPLAFLGASLIGLGMGGEGDLMPYLMSRYFGLRSLGEIYGLIFAVFTLSGAVGPLLMSVGFDRTGSYGTPLALFLIATLISTISITRLGPYRFAGQSGSIQGQSVHALRKLPTISRN